MIKRTILVGLLLAGLLALSGCSTPDGWYGNSNISETTDPVKVLSVKPGFVLVEVPQDLKEGLPAVKVWAINPYEGVAVGTNIIVRTSTSGSFYVNGYDPSTVPSVPPVSSAPSEPTTDDSTSDSTLNW